MTHFGTRKTKARRDAINKRAAELPRPISAWQAEALREMARAGRLFRGRAGWSSARLINKYWQSQTVLSLRDRGLCLIHARRFALITAAGRRELKRHPQPHAWGHR